MRQNTMLKKIIISVLFDFPIPWIEQHYNNFNRLGAEWEHLIFTDLLLPSVGNIKVHRVDVEWFKNLVETKTGVRPHVPVPSPKFGDTRPAFGNIFEDYIKDADFWGHIDFDIVLGNLDRWLTDEFLSGCDIFSSDIKIVNGIFSLYRNISAINLLYRQCSGWEEIFKDTKYHAFDEVEFSQHVVKVAETGDIRFVDRYWHGNDREYNPRLQILDDGTLIDHWNRGQEIMLYHFRRTKEWPL
jgi:hypothetical protein